MSNDEYGAVDVPRAQAAKRLTLVLFVHRQRHQRRQLALRVQRLNKLF